MFTPARLVDFVINSHTTHSLYEGKMQLQFHSKLKSSWYLMRWSVSQPMKRRVQPRWCISKQLTFRVLVIVTTPFQIYLVIHIFFCIYIHVYHIKDSKELIIWMFYHILYGNHLSKIVFWHTTSCYALIIYITS